MYRIEDKGAKYSELESGRTKRKKRRMSERLQRAIASHLANTSSGVGTISEEDVP